MSNLIQHPYHMVNESPWPIMSSIFALNITIGLLMWFYINSILLLLFSLFFILLTAMLWWEDISREATFQGLHTSIVVLGLRWGMILFICSEVFFFLSFFWAFFHSSLAPNIEVGSHWPPLTIPVFNPWGVPLLNTIILVSSGVSITYSHKSLENNTLMQSKYYLFITIMLGVYFTLVQGLEYLDAPFTMSDSIYGSTFFIATGFHGLHVIVGSIFLIVCLIRMEKGGFSQLHHFGFVAAIWYWHFVDIVWLFLFLWIYVWGASTNLFCLTI